MRLAALGFYVIIRSRMKVEFHNGSASAALLAVAI